LDGRRPRTAYSDTSGTARAATHRLRNHQHPRRYRGECGRDQAGAFRHDRAGDCRERTRDAGRQIGGTAAERDQHRHRLVEPQRLRAQTREAQRRRHRENRRQRERGPRAGAAIRRPTPGDAHVLCSNGDLHAIDDVPVE